jgi:hypothetical protein
LNYNRPPQRRDSKEEKDIKAQAKYNSVLINFVLIQADFILKFLFLFEKGAGKNHFRLAKTTERIK